MKAVIAILACATALGACTKKDNPANQAAQDIKGMGAQRDKAQDAIKSLEDSQRKASDAAKAAEGDSGNN